ncbi:hypothetical protein [Runella salmonicolor]|uniref:Uncharacterized protein n=1 Tax=Runella salmonicolor TaxID=2950278 RepID=A0ABT1FRP7_9BACT|nr:hypothetical protein [Runella salmonicolor]MCP1384435.1 hypothetical protein [Runella salmonicolor]
MIIGLAIWQQYRQKNNTAVEKQTAKTHAETVQKLEKKRQINRADVDNIPVDSLAVELERAYSKPNSYEAHHDK